MNNLGHTITVTDEIDVSVPDVTGNEMLMRKYTLGSFYSTMKQMDAIKSTLSSLCPSLNG